MCSQSNTYIRYITEHDLLLLRIFYFCYWAAWVVAAILMNSSSAQTWRATSEKKLRHYVIVKVSELVDSTGVRQNGSAAGMQKTAGVLICRSSESSGVSQSAVRLRVLLSKGQH